MKTEELREQTSGELDEIERDLRRELWKCRFENYTNQLDDTAKIHRLRRDIARVKTLHLQQSASKEQ